MLPIVSLIVVLGLAIEGVAAGAALTAVVATMIPEAVHLAGSGRRIGTATLLGFVYSSKPCARL